MGALMLSILLGTAFVGRQIWGVISDRIGGLPTVLIGSAWQAASTQPKGDWRFLQAFPKSDARVPRDAGASFHFVPRANAYDIVVF
jgi:hypothetical protein